MVVVVLSKEGDQVPLMPLFEMVSSSLKASPEQIAGICVKIGVIIGFTITVISARSVEHSPASGVNSYVVVAILFIAGDQVPVTPLFDVVGNAKTSPLQIGST